MNFKENLNFKYWNTFYKNKKLTNKATKFAAFCYKKLKNYNKSRHKKVQNKKLNNNS